MEAIIKKQFSSSGKSITWLVVDGIDSFKMATKQAALQLANHLNKIKERLATNAKPQPEQQEDNQNDRRNCPESIRHGSDIPDHVLGTTEMRAEHAASNSETTRTIGDEGSGLRNETFNAGESSLIRRKKTTSPIDQLLRNTVTHLQKERQLARDSRQLARDCLDLATAAVGVAKYCATGDFNSRPNTDNQRSLEQTTIEVEAVVENSQEHDTGTTCGIVLVNRPAFLDDGDDDLPF